VVVVVVVSAAEEFTPSTLANVKSGATGVALFATIDALSIAEILRHSQHLLRPDRSAKSSPERRRSRRLFLRANAT
jgi:hypothetical protein